MEYNISPLPKGLVKKIGWNLEEVLKIVEAVQKHGLYCDSLSDTSINAKVLGHFREHWIRFDKRDEEVIAEVIQTQCEGFHGVDKKWRVYAMYEPTKNFNYKSLHGQINFEKGLLVESVLLSERAPSKSSQ